jgi:hypothetical protein
LAGRNDGCWLVCRPCVWIGITPWYLLCTPTCQIFSLHIVKLPLLIRLLKTKRYLLKQGPYAIFFRNTILQSVMLLAQKQVDRLCTAKIPEIPELPPKFPKTWILTLIKDSVRWYVLRFFFRQWGSGWLERAGKWFHWTLMLHKFSDAGVFRAVFSGSRAVFSNRSIVDTMWGLEKASTALKMLL